MKKFEFSTRNYTCPFVGEVFYNAYKNADFLRQSDNIQTILAKGYELRQMLKEVEPGQVVTLSGMLIDYNHRSRLTRIFVSHLNVGWSKRVYTSSIQGINDIPSGLFPSSRAIPFGSRIASTLSVTRALRIMSLIFACFDRRPALWRHERPCTPLLVKKTGPNVPVETHEFTANRLSGLVAAYAYENRSRLPSLVSTEAQALALTWDNYDKKKSRLYLSAVSGTEHFYKMFQFWPLVCALKKLQLKKITVEPVIKMAKIKNKHGVSMATDLLKNLPIVTELWTHFPGSKTFNLKKEMESMPHELKYMFSRIY